MKNLAPIVLFVYNRPAHTKRTVEGLLNNPEAKDSELFIFSDAAKANASEKEKCNVAKVRKYIHTIKGFKNIVIEEATINKGLAKSTIDGCSKILNMYERIIMFEDDDVPTPYFLAFANECLEKFKDDENIWCVSGYVDADILPPDNDADVFLVNRPSSWGFATWKRCWDKVIWDIPTLKGIFAHKGVFDSYDEWCGQDSSVIMRGLFDKRNNSWSTRYNFAAYLNKSLTILPNKSLIDNIGCDGTGTNCSAKDFRLDLMDRNVSIPDVIFFNKNKNKKLLNSYKPQSFVMYIRFWLVKHPKIEKIVRYVMRKKLSYDNI